MNPSLIRYGLSTAYSYLSGASSVQPSPQRRSLQFSKNTDNTLEIRINHMRLSHVIFLELLFLINGSAQSLQGEEPAQV